MFSTNKEVFQWKQSRVNKTQTESTKIRQHVNAKIGEEKFKKKVYYNDPAPSISQEEYTSTREIKDISKWNPVRLFLPQGSSIKNEAVFSIMRSFPLKMFHLCTRATQLAIQFFNSLIKSSWRKKETIPINFQPNHLSAKSKVWLVLVTIPTSHIAKPGFFSGILRWFRRVTPKFWVRWRFWLR